MPKKIHPVILSGGVGSRLWPVSRRETPKQFQPLLSDKALFRETLERFQDENFADPVIICSEAHRFSVGDILSESGITPEAILLEPEARNTAPATGAAAAWLEAREPGAIMFLLPSDHVITDRQAFLSLIPPARKAAEKGALSTLGITPESPETGYGYIERGETFRDVDNCHHVKRFVEKPDRETAREYLETGKYFWNSGMFLFRSDVFLKELAMYEPATATACCEAAAEAEISRDFVRLAPDAFSRTRATSIDYAVMEHTQRAAVLPARIGWNDVGSWAAIHDLCPRDPAGNVLRGDVTVHNVHDSLIRSEGLPVVTAGLEDTIVVTTEEAVLVVPRKKAQDVKILVNKLKAAGREDLL